MIMTNLVLLCVRFIIKKAGSFNIPSKVMLIFTLLYSLSSIIIINNIQSNVFLFSSLSFFLSPKKIINFHVFTGHNIMMMMCADSITILNNHITYIALLLLNFPVCTHPPQPFSCISHLDSNKNSFSHV